MVVKNGVMVWYGVVHHGGEEWWYGVVWWDGGMVWYGVMVVLPAGNDYPGLYGLLAAHAVMDTLSVGLSVS